MTASKNGPGAASVLLPTLSIVAGLLAVQCAIVPATSTGGRPAPQQCVSRATQMAHEFAFVHGYITYSDGSNIWAVDPNHPARSISLGPPQPRATTWPYAGTSPTPIAWARDGRRLLLNVRTGAGTAQEGQDLCVVNADGSQTRLTSDGQGGGGSFSQDGTKVAFSRSDGLYTVDAKGGTPRLVAKSYEAWWLADPAWSPDGSRIAYIVYLEGGPEGNTDQIWSVKSDGTDPRPLVDLGDGGSSGGLVWSPDGSMLAFHSRRGSPSRTSSIYVVQADGSGLGQITDGLISYLWPAWSPDGLRIAFLQQGPGELYTAALDGGEVRQVEGIFVMSTSLAWNPVA